MNFGENLKFIREEKKLTQNELANLLNVSKANISRYELGIRQPSIDTIFLVAKFFNVSIDWLLGRSSIKNFSSVNNNPRDFNTEDLDILEFVKENNDIRQVLQEIKIASNVKVKVFFEIWKVINKQL